MVGEGVWAQLLRQRFDKAVLRLGLNRDRVPLDLSLFRKPVPSSANGQRDLFS